MSIKERMTDWVYSKVVVFIGYLLSVGLITDGAQKKAQTTPKPTTPEPTMFLSLSLEDWQVIVGIVLSLTLIIPRLYEGYKWIRKKFKRKQ